MDRKAEISAGISPDNVQLINDCRASADGSAVKRATKAFHPELGNGSFDLLHRLQKAEPGVPRREQFDDDHGEKGKIQNWHAFKTP
jgi:hypothetical protein